jgi:UrcA family protein
MANWAGGRRIYSGAMNRKHHSMIRPLIAAALFALLAVPPALAADPTEMAVSTGDLDLRSPAGQAELKVRVSNAASTLCQPAWMRKTPDSEFAVGYNQQIYRACVARLTDRAMDRVGRQLAMMAEVNSR